MTAPTVLIAGAGVAGLSAAWFLARQGYRPLVVERAPDLRADGYMLGLSGPGYMVAGRMGLLPALKDRARDIRENVYRGRDGRVLLRLNYREVIRGMEYVTVSRTELVQVLHAAVRDAAEIRFGTTVDSLDVTGDVTGDTTGGRALARLSDGTAVEAEFALGCDGVHSQMRGLLFGPEAAFARHLGYRVAAFPIAADLDLGADFMSFAEPGRLAEFYTLAGRQAVALYVWRSDETRPLPPESREAALRAAFAGAHPDALRLIGERARDTPMFFDAMTMIDMPAWSRGRALLLGDAAHCLTLISGQGAGIAMTSASLLAEALAGGAGVEAAFAAHERRLRPAVARLQDRSRKMAAVFVPASPRAFAIRNFVMRHLPRRLLGWYFLQAARSELGLSAGLLEGEAPAAAGPR